MSKLTEEIAARPFLKWAGGKQRLFPQYVPLFPREFSAYHEPFLGAGAVFFGLWNQERLQGEVVLSDSNEELVTVYRVVRDDLPELERSLQQHQQLHSRKHYYEVRGLDRRADVSLGAVERAARTIYLNRTCYNGLYRVNRRGQFNVPIGQYKKPKIYMADRLRSASQALGGVSLTVADFRSILERASPGDFVYFDPPYDPVSETADFTAYTSGSFTGDDQEALADVFHQLSRRGCFCMLSNSYTDRILRLYQDFHIEKVRAHRAISARGAGRGPVAEVVVLNYPPPA